MHTASVERHAIRKPDPWFLCLILFVPLIVSGQETGSSVADYLATQKAKLQAQLAKDKEREAKAQSALDQARHALASAEGSGDAEAAQIARQAVKIAEGALSKAQAQSQQTIYRIKLTQRALDNLPPEDAVDRLADRVLSWYGEKISEQVDNEFVRDPGFVADHEQVKRLVGLVERLQKLSSRPDDRLPIKILKGNQVEMMAGATRTTIYVEKAYLDLNPSDDELMFVLGHELTHAQRDHIAKHVLKQKGESALNRLQNIDASDPEVKEIINQAALAARMSDYSKAQEKEADLVGAQLAIGAGASTNGIRDALDRMQRWYAAGTAMYDEPRRKLELLTADHPTPPQRRQYLEEALGIKLR